MSRCHCDQCRHGILHGTPMPACAALLSFAPYLEPATHLQYARDCEQAACVVGRPRHSLTLDPLEVTCAACLKTATYHECVQAVLQRHDAELGEMHARLEALEKKRPKR